MENTPFVMNIKDPKNYDENGKRIKNLGYAARVGGSLANLLKEHESVQMVALGASPVNNAVKALHYAQRILKQEDLDLAATKFEIIEVSLSSTRGANRQGKATAITVNLIR